jgi:hypothetical protein
MLIFYSELPIEQGFEVLDKPKHDRLIRGRQVSACSGWNLFKTLQGQPIKCWSCGCEADRWIADRGKNNLVGHPVLNLYGIKDDCIVLMNRDHIIPKSLGGTDALENLRPACEVCNGARGNSLTPEELQFRKDNPHLVSDVRLAAGKSKAKKAIKRHNNEVEREKIAEAFHTIGEEL